MQALSMIDMGAKAPETAVPGKPGEPKGKEFGQVLNDRQRPEKPQHNEAAATKQEPKEKPEVAKTAKAEERSEVVKEVKSNEQSERKQAAGREVAEEQRPAHADANSQAEPQVQHIVVNLLKAIAADEMPETDAEFGSMEELLSQLVQQVDSGELKGEQVLAGIDLSALVEQLEQISAMQLQPELQGGMEFQDGEDPLKQLVSQLAAQLAGENSGGGVQQNAELASGGLPVAEPQSTAASLTENLKQARQLLQQAIDSVNSQRPAEKQVELQPVESAEQPVAQDLLLAEEAAEEIDPRFAGLLKPRSEGRFNQQPSLRERIQSNNPQQNSAKLNPSGETAQAATELNPELAKIAELAERLDSKPKPAMENLVQQAQGNLQQAGPQLNPNQANARLMADAVPTVQLPSGQQVAESQIFDQVVARVSGSFNGESGRMVLRLQPAELGSLKLELMVEGDRVRASLQAQSLQVQEVLERNLPQLRNALAEQGLKIDQFQVDVNQQQDQQGQFDNLARQQQRQGSQQQPAWQQPVQPEDQIVPLAHLMQNGGGGISLHV